MHAVVAQGLMKSFGETHALDGCLDDNVREALDIHVAANAFQSLLWIIGVLGLFVPLCVGRYRRLSR